MGFLYGYLQPSIYPPTGAGEEEKGRVVAPGKMYLSIPESFEPLKYPQIKNTRAHHSMINLSGLFTELSWVEQFRFKSYRIATQNNYLFQQ